MRRALILLVVLLALVVAATASAHTAGVFFLRGERVAAVHRDGAPIAALLRGPSAADRARGLSTTIPSGTRLLGFARRNGVAVVNLSRRFDDGGGSLSMRARLAQLVYTATAERGIRAVELRLAGKKVRVFSGEGLILTQPLTRAMFRDFRP
jgi:spore germination protein GerM